MPDYDDIVDAAIIIVTAGANQKLDETRLDLYSEKCWYFQIHHSEIAKETAEESQDRFHRGYPDLHGIEIVRFPGKQGAWPELC